MDLFDFDDMKKPNSNNRLPSLSKLFRLIELCLAVVLFSWIFNRLIPFAVTKFGHFFRQFSGVIASPLFVFFLCNAIIVTLIVKSERFSGEISAVDNAGTQFYEELLENHKSSSSKQLSPEELNAEETEFQDKEVISEESAGEDGGDAAEMEMPLILDSDSDPESECDTPRVYRRWKSEKVEREEKDSMKLRRLETEKFIKSKGQNDGVLSPGEELSDEEFQRAVDDFIAKHFRFRRQESQVIFQN